MTTSYDPTVNPGDTRNRIWRMTMENPLGGTPMCYAHEELVIRTADGERAVGRSRDMQKSPTDLAEVVELRNPDGDALLGSTTIGAIYAAIYSLGRHMQKAADQE